MLKAGSQVQGAVGAREFLTRSAKRGKGFAVAAGKHRPLIERNQMPGLDSDRNFERTYSRGKLFNRRSFQRGVLHPLEAQIQLCGRHARHFFVAFKLRHHDLIPTLLKSTPTLRVIVCSSAKDHKAPWLRWITLIQHSKEIRRKRGWKGCERKRGLLVINSSLLFYLEHKRVLELQAGKYSSYLDYFLLRFRFLLLPRHGVHLPSLQPLSGNLQSLAGPNRPASLREGYQVAVLQRVSDSIGRIFNHWVRFDLMASESGDGLGMDNTPGGNASNSSEVAFTSLSRSQPGG